MSKSNILTWDPVGKKYITKGKESTKPKEEEPKDSIELDNDSVLSGNEEDYKYTKDELDDVLDSSIGIKSSKKRQRQITDTDSEFEEVMHPKPITCPSDKIKDMYKQLKNMDKALKLIHEHNIKLQLITEDIFKDMKKLKKDLY
nr:hypothetical protein [Cressdnaviricota sp.]UOF81299.1 hypothetical protein [Cressdnaviricota sp.]